MYVLKPALQDGKKIPKWQPRARLGMFVGMSQCHSSLAPLILNVATGKISPQYHVVFDNAFSTVPSIPAGESLEAQWTHIFRLGCETYLPPPGDDDDPETYYPPLSPEWNDPRYFGTAPSDHS